LTRLLAQKEEDGLIPKTVDRVRDGLPKTLVYKRGKWARKGPDMP